VSSGQMCFTAWMPFPSIKPTANNHPVSESDSHSPNLQWRHGLKKLGVGSCNFPTDTCKFPTEDVWVLKNFNLATNSLKNVGFPVPNFVFLEHFPRGRKFSDRLKFREGGSCPPPATWCYCQLSQFDTAESEPQQRILTDYYYVT